MNGTFNNGILTKYLRRTRCIVNYEYARGKSCERSFCVLNRWLRRLRGFLSSELVLQEFPSFIHERRDYVETVYNEAKAYERDLDGGVKVFQGKELLHVYECEVGFLSSFGFANWAKYSWIRRGTLLPKSSICIRIFLYFFTFNREFEWNYWKKRITNVFFFFFIRNL